MSEAMRFDDILINHIGQLGLYQKVHYLLVGIPVIFAGMHALSWTFVGASVKYRCLYPGEDSGTTAAVYETDSLWHKEILSNLSRGLSACRRISGIRYGDPVTTPETQLTSEKCPEHSFAWDHSDMSYSAVERWSLICDRDYIVATVQALFFVGKLFGSLFFGILSDRFGRKPVFICAIVLQVLFGATQAAVPNWGLMAFLRAGTGFCSAGVFIMSVVVGAELVGPDYRMWSSIVSGIFWSIGEIILGGLSYPLRDYRYLQLAISLPALLLLCYWWIIPESPRWLLSRGRHEEVEAIMNRVAKWNGKGPLAKGWSEKVHQKEENEQHHQPWWKNARLLFTSSRLRCRLFVSCVLWGVGAMGYYGLAINPAFMGGDNRTGFLLSGVLEIPGQLFVLTVNILGRRLILFGGFLLSGLCIGLTLAVPSSNPISALLLVVVGKSALMAVFSVLYIWTPEHYPTSIRNTAVGACYMFARFGAIAASYLSLKLAKDYPASIALTFAVSAALVAGLSLLLPETTGEPYTETIQEAEALGLGQPVWICGYKNKRVVDERTKPNSKRNA